ncbi:MAG: YajQ family cyclic di-GMP-binding protein [Kistimonas sp.]|nr:YajQ family cyclic di-GMP-binding protein [Kistimonas sp.]
MPSFDVVSEVDTQDLKNAIDQARRELDSRYDFRGVGADFELQKDSIVMTAEAESQLNQMLDILKIKMEKCRLDSRCLDPQSFQPSGKQVRRSLLVRQGLEAAHSKTIIKLIKDTKLKVQASMQDGQVRVSGKKRNDLQAVIELLKEAKLERPLQFQNLRD